MWAHKMFKYSFPADPPFADNLPYYIPSETLKEIWQELMIYAYNIINNFRKLSLSCFWIIIPSNAFFLRTYSHQ